MASPARLDDVGVSRFHFALVPRSGGLLVEDLSSNGTFVNGARLPNKSPVPLKPGDLIEIPGYKIEMSWAAGEPESAVPDPAVSMAAGKLPVPPAFQAFLVSFTFWELLLIAAILGSLILIAVYLSW